MESDIKIPNNEGGSAPDGTCSVCVAVHIRPLIAPELAEGCQSCVQSTARPAQVQCLWCSVPSDFLWNTGCPIQQNTLRQHLPPQGNFDSTYPYIPRLSLPLCPGHGHDPEDSGLSCIHDVQVFAGASSFTYDHVFGGEGLPEASLYPSCVLPLVEGLFKGYNATVFAYGQTGSGKLSK